MFNAWDEHTEWLSLIEVLIDWKSIEAFHELKISAYEEVRFLW